jgi:two-component system osmolarity sensor histidine kinase EnvZ
MDDATRAGMVDDIAEMDRIIGQFLEFARTDADAAREPADANAIVGSCVERYVRAGKDVRFTPGAVPIVPLRSTAFSRLTANLVDNAIAYGAPPVEVTTHMAGSELVLDVADRGPGIAPAEVLRLKQPFTRASPARSNAAGVAGAGLGLAIVDRIARLHGGTFDLLPRDGGGTVARVRIPVAL